MALKLNYVARETGSNLWRNVSLTIASVLTVAVSLFLFGVAQLVYHGVGNATARWKGGIEFIVFMKSQATQEQLDAVQNSLENSPQVKSVTFVDKKAAYEEFKTLFARSPEMIDVVKEDAMPPSFKIAPNTDDADVIQQLGKQFEDDPGVREVVFAFEAVRTMKNFSGVLRVVLLVGACVLLGVALLLILNAIRMAMFARRREIEVMKLVGATNWFVRVPFMLEGLIQGLIGALVAAVLVLGLNWAFDGWLTRKQEMNIFQSFAVSGSQVTTTTVVLVLVGCLIGGAGSALAVSRYLDV